VASEQNILDLVTIQYQALDARLDSLQASIDTVETRLKAQEAAFSWYLERLADMNPMFRVYHSAYNKKKD
jgi:prefoldin subunit 5